MTMEGLETMKKLVEKDKKGRGGIGPDYIGEMETTGFQ